MKGVQKKIQKIEPIFLGFFKLGFEKYVFLWSSS